MCLLTNDWSPIMVYKDKGLFRAVVHYKVVTWRQCIFKHPAASNYAIIKECVTMNRHCWTGVFAVELPLLSLCGSERIFSLCSVNLTLCEILFLLSLLSIFVISSVLLCVRGSNSPFSVILDIPTCISPCSCQNRFSPAHSFTPTHERRQQIYEE